FPMKPAASSRRATAPDAGVPAADTGPSVSFRRADFAADHDAIRAIRFAVFVDEQRVPPELELDERDPACIHLLCHADGAPIATGRIDVAYGGKIGRVAVLASHRRSGIGTALMHELHEIARQQGLASVWCNAQISA